MAKLVTIDFMDGRNFYTFKINEGSFDIQVEKGITQLVNLDGYATIEELNEAFTMVLKYEKVGKE